MKRAAPVLLVVLGLAQMVGDALGIAPLRALAAATTASPAPKVFSAVNGLETYSSRFFVEWTDHSGERRSFEITPETYKPLRGPYNRRNAYGAVFAYGPVLVGNPATKPLFDSVARYAFCGDAPLLEEIGVPVDEVADDRRVRVEPLPNADTGDLPLIIDVTCS